MNRTITSSRQTVGPLDSIDIGSLVWIDDRASGRGTYLGMLTSQMDFNAQGVGMASLSHDLTATSGAIHRLNSTVCAALSTTVVRVLMPSASIRTETIQAALSEAMDDERARAFGLERPATEILDDMLALAGALQRVAI